MALTEEEKKKQSGTMQAPVYRNTAPQGTYWGEQGNPGSDAYESFMRTLAERNNPSAQAEQDARIQRGRQFWAGGALFANVVANAINANGTAKGAPAMTFNNDMEKAMYARWQDADKELRADRREAQRRYEAMMLQDAQLRAAGAEKRGAEAAKAYDVNYQNSVNEVNQANKWAREDEVREATWQHENEKTLQQQQFSAEQAAKQRAFQASENKKTREHQETVADIRAQRAKGYNKGTKTIRIGNDDFKAETEAEADSNIAQVYGMVLSAYNRTQDNMHQQTFDGKPETEYSFINAHINQLYANDPQFKAQYDEWRNQHQRSVSSSTGQGGSWLQGTNSNSWLQ